MKLSNYVSVAAVAAALAGCASQPASSPGVRYVPRVPEPVTDSAPAPAVPVPAPVPTTDEIKAKLLQQQREVLRHKQELDEEWRRLASYQKNLFQVFKLSESVAGFQAMSNLLGVFELKAAKSGKMRVSLAQLPDSPARLSVGSYTVSFDVSVDYVETQECVAGDCVGKILNIVRSVQKTVLIPISAKGGFTGTRDLSFLNAQTGAPIAKNYRVSYSNLKMRVRRMSVEAPRGRVD